MADAVDISQGLQPSETAAAPTDTTAAPASTPTPAPAAPAANPPAATTAQPAPAYTLDDTPQFLRDSLPMDKVKVDNSAPANPDDAKATAYVKPDSPDTINVANPTQMTQTQLDHELSHSYMYHLESQGVKFAPINTKDPYNYGGVDQLVKDQQNGKKATDYSQEQLAKMVEEQAGRVKNLQVWAKTGTIQQKDIDDYNKWRSAVTPIFQQLTALNKGAKKYTAQPDDPHVIRDIPEFSNTKIDLSAGLQPTSQAATPGPKPAGF